MTLRFPSFGRSFILALALGAALPLAVRAAGEEDQISSESRDVAAAKAAEAPDGWWTDSMKTRDQRLEWFRDARFGCFIHWGVYAGPAGVWNGKNVGTYSEHLMRLAKIPLAEYTAKVVAPFDPEQFNADEWVSLIKSAGMKYVIITSKHHDGFAMWPSDVTKYNIRDATQFKRDPMKELSEACHKNGIRFGFYYSHAFDWEDPNAPGNDWDYENPGGDRKLFGGATWWVGHPELVERCQKYVDTKAIPQLQELVAKYHPDIFWFDVSGKMPFSLQLKVVEAVRKADPKVVINGRAARGQGRNWGDYADTADRPAEIRPTPGDWECIPTCNESYGYHKLDNKYKPPSHFIQLLAKAAAKGGNVLLNIGPMGNGQIDPNATGILQGIGAWMSVNSDSIYATQRTPLERQAWGESTVKGDNLYLHVFQWPADGKLIVGGLQSDASSAYLLADTSKAPLAVSRLNENDEVVTVPAKAPDAVDSVVVLKMNGPIKALPGRLLATHDLANHLLAFDGQAHGKFTYGDGKTNRWYAAGFGKSSDSIEWKTRLNEPADFNVTVRYSTANKSAKGGEFKVTLGDQSLSGKVEATASATDIADADLGKVHLNAGEQVLKIQGASDQSGELMQLFEIVLSPTK
jgi:alpha-L-fucosidase